MKVIEISQSSNIILLLYSGTNCLAVLIKKFNLKLLSRASKYFATPPSHLVLFFLTETFSTSAPISGLMTCKK